MQALDDFFAEAEAPGASGGFASPPMMPEEETEKILEQRQHMERMRALAPEVMRAIAMAPGDAPREARALPGDATATGDGAPVVRRRKMYEKQAPPQC